MAITYEQFRTMLPIHKHRLDDELEIHAQLQEQISHETTLRNSRMLEAKEELAKTEARVADDLREDDPKITVAAVTAKLYRAPERVRAWQKYQEARAEHERWDGLLSAWKQKGYSIKTLADLYASQYFALQSHHRKERPDRPAWVGQSDAGVQDDTRAAMRVASSRPRAESREASREETRTPTRRRIAE